MSEKTRETTADKPARRRSIPRVLFRLAVYAAVIFALVRVFIFHDVEAFRVSSSSMEPTLVGGEDYGDNILVNRLSYTLGNPERWDVAVFQFPPGRKGYEDEKGKIYVKRIAGMPGETLYIQSGDLYVERGPDEKPEILKKPDSLQKRLWLTVYEMARLTGPVSDYWDTGTRFWSEKDGGLEFDGSDVKSDTRFLHTVLDKASHTVGDLYIGLDVRVEEGTGGISIFLQEDDYTTFELRLASEGTPAHIWMPVVQISGINSIVTGLPRLEPGTTHHIEISNVDDTVTFKFDDKVIHTSDYTENHPYLFAEPEIKISAKGVRTRIENITIKRDIYYTGDAPDGRYADGPHNAIHIPEDSYFMLGDNSALSADSRVWGCVPRENLIGRAFLIFHPFSRISLIR